MFSESGKIIILTKTRPKNEIEDFKFSSIPCGWRNKSGSYEAQEAHFKLPFIFAITNERNNEFSNNRTSETRYKEFGHP